jgi:hypothetical protein
MLALFALPDEECAENMVTRVVMLPSLSPLCGIPVYIVAIVGLFHYTDQSTPFITPSSVLVGSIHAYACPCKTKYPLLEAKDKAVL